MQAVVVSLAVGLIAGWLASVVIGGTELTRCIVIGIIGAFLGEVVFENIRLPIGDPLIAQLIFTTLGAIILIVLGRALFRYFPP